MKKVYGFLVLGLVVLSGITFVEVNHRTESPRPTYRRHLYRVVLGGGDPVATADEIPEARDAKTPLPPRDPEPALRTSIPSDPPPLPNLDPPVPPLEFRYTVRAGDTLGEILIAYLGSASPRLVDRVVNHNGMKNANQLLAGDLLRIPVDHYDEHRADGMESIADIANRAFGDRRRVRALVQVNHHLSLDAHAIPPANTVIYIPR